MEKNTNKMQVEKHLSQVTVAVMRQKTFVLNLSDIEQTFLMTK